MIDTLEKIENNAFPGHGVHDWGKAFVLVAGVGLVEVDFPVGVVVSGKVLDGQLADCVDDDA